MKPQHILILCTGLLIAADAPKELQGVWVVTKLEEGGKADAKALGDTITIEGEKFKIWSKEEKKEVATGKFKFDASAKPATVDMIMAGPGGKEATMNGLYQLDGDTIKFCFALKPGNDRPKEIAAKEDTVLITLKKEKK